MDPNPSISPDVLPLFLYYQHEARERLRIIQQMQEHIAYLQGRIDKHVLKTDSPAMAPRSEYTAPVRASESAIAEVDAIKSPASDDFSKPLRFTSWSRMSRLLSRLTRRKN
jgi:hypothetical protein